MWWRSCHASLPADRATRSPWGHRQTWRWARVSSTATPPKWRSRSSRLQAGLGAIGEGRSLCGGGDRLTECQTRSRLSAKTRAHVGAIIRGRSRIGIRFSRAPNSSS